MPPKRSRRVSSETSHLVAKIGGSLSSSASLSDWLAALRQFPYRLTIAPGGGPFAEAVRQAQKTMRFSDGTAHVMALLAMEQYAIALAELDDELVGVSTLEEAATAHDRGAVALWRPFHMTRNAPIPASWDMTSDSLAAWYAREAEAPVLLLVKSVDVSEETDVVAEGIVDPLFPRYTESLRVFIAGPADLAGAAAVLRDGGVPGRGIILDNSRRQTVAS